MQKYMLVSVGVIAHNYSRPCGEHRASLSCKPDIITNLNLIGCVDFFNSFLQFTKHNQPIQFQKIKCSGLEQNCDVRAILHILGLFSFSFSLR